MALIWIFPLLFFYTLPILHPCSKWENSVDVISISLKNRDKAQHIRMDARRRFTQKREKGVVINNKNE